MPEDQFGSIGQNIGEEIIGVALDKGVPLGSIGQEVIENVLEVGLPPDLRPSEPINITDTNFLETEPNDTLDQANDIGSLALYDRITISGHLNGSSDPYDYFAYVATEPGNIQVDMYTEGNIIYSETFQAKQANEPFYYYGLATGDTDFDYETRILLMPEGDLFA